MAYGTTEEIKARTNIVELIGSYVKLTKSGAHFKACCPFHQERTPSFMVNEERNMWHCFGCGKGGDVFAFVMEMEGLGFRDALTLLAERAGVTLPKYERSEPGAEKENKERLYDALELATKFYEKQLWDGPGKEKILQYLRERGLSDESIKKFRLGYAPSGWRHTADFLTSKGFTAEILEHVGLLLKKENGPGHYDRFRDRILFPIFDILGRVIGYSARVAPGGDESQAKYINTPETPIYHKSRALYGLYLAKQAMKRLGETVIVEGNMDVIAMHQAGIENTLAVSGTALTGEQLSIMKRYGQQIKLFFDMDGAGQKAARKSAELALLQEFSVSIVAIPSGKDAADMGKENPKQLQEAVVHAIPAPKYFLDAVLAKHDRFTADGKRHIVEGYAELLAAIKNPIERAHWMKVLAQEIGTDERAVRSVLQAAQGRFVGTARQGVAADAAIAKAHPFGKRSELLRETLVGILYAEPSARKIGTLLPAENETRVFLERHPLFFFLVQAGDGDPLALIEESALKSEATRLSFQALESPDIANIPAEDRPQKMAELAEKYFEMLQEEVGRREKLRALEQDIRAAREKNDKELEKTLLAEFSRVSAQKLSF